MELEERVAQLEAEAIVMRRYLRALISLLPQEQRINGVLTQALRTINLDARTLPADQQQALTRANAGLGVLAIPRIGLLAASAP